MSDFKWTDERVKKFARVYCGNPTDGFEAEDFHGKKMEEKVKLFKEQCKIHDDFVLLSLLADTLEMASTKGDLVEVDFYHAKMGRIISRMWERNPSLMPKGEPFNPLVSTSTQDLRDELSRRGYAVGHGCVWQSNDVVPFDPTNSLTEDERMHIMSRVLNSDWLTDQIMSMIEDEVVAYKNEDQ
jgi:hypothetical protein